MMVNLKIKEVYLLFVKLDEEFSDFKSSLSETILLLQNVINFSDAVLYENRKFYGININSKRELENSLYYAEIIDSLLNKIQQVSDTLVFTSDYLKDRPELSEANVKLNNLITFPIQNFDDICVDLNENIGDIFKSKDDDTSE